MHSKSVNLFVLLLYYLNKASNTLNDFFLIKLVGKPDLLLEVSLTDFSTFYFYFPSDYFLLLSEFWELCWEFGGVDLLKSDPVLTDRVSTIK